MGLSAKLLLSPTSMVEYNQDLLKLSARLVAFCEKMLLSPERKYETYPEFIKSMKICSGGEGMNDENSVSVKK